MKVLQQNQKMLLPYQRYKDALDNANDRIYNNAYKYNGVLGNPIDKNAFGTRNDFVFNKNIAMQHEREKEELKRNPAGIEERLKNMEAEKEYEKKLYQDKLDNQKLYKEYLNKFILSQKNIKNIINNQKGHTIYPSKPKVNCRSSNNSKNKYLKEMNENKSNSGARIKSSNKNKKSNFKATEIGNLKTVLTFFNKGDN